MTTPDSPGAGEARRRWKQALTAGPDCVPLERLAEIALSADEQGHVEHCARCQTERDLLRAFESAEPAADEGAAVTWIAAETRRRVFPDAGSTAQARPRRWWPLPAWAISMAAVVLVATGAYLVLRTPAMTVDGGGTATVYRAVGVELTSPLGEIDEAPDRLLWRPVENASSYDVRVLEVDGTEVWRAASPTTSIEVPDVVRAAARPARTLSWSVAALDAAGRRLGEPGTGTFRVRPPGP